ncbi:hypothetical protein [uncultured Microbacterium sp.]|uniref:Aminoglycoside phosphotransferase n=1 Tax=uncultured Microbacterium sp. TaxID=191216 RepID=A0A1Y5P307_9MICO|nr:hypothetical protein [uncultured Microbacterium sp.]SBS73043.1 hypothetical protein MIPYR_30371 [uncultured Microbacterium sp.]
MSAALNGLPSEWADLSWQPTGIGAGLLSWQGASHESWRATTGAGVTVLAKAPRPHAVGTAAARARLAASEAGVGPQILAMDADGGVTVERALDERWRVATGLRLQAPGAVSALAVARRRFRESGADLPARDLGAEAQTMLDDLAAVGAPQPLALAPVASALPGLRAAVADGPAPVPSWLSSELSDIQVGPDGTVMLTGGTTAGLADPLADVGSILTEVSPTVLPAEEAFLLLWGSDHPGAFARARLWGTITDLWVLLRALRAHALEPDAEVGYLGYLMFRIWHAEHPVLTGEIDALIARAGEGWE